MNLFWVIIILLLSFIFQTTILSLLTILGVGPNLILVLILFLVLGAAFSKKELTKTNWLIIILTGLLMDFFSNLPFGVNAISLAAAVYLSYWLNRDFFSKSGFWMKAGTVVLASLAYDLILFGLLYLLRAWAGGFYFLIKHLLISPGYNFILFILLYAIKKIFYKKQAKAGY